MIHGQHAFQKPFQIAICQFCGRKFLIIQIVASECIDSQRHVNRIFANDSRLFMEFCNEVHIMRIRVGIFLEASFSGE